MPWSSRPTSDFLRWTQFFLCDVCLLIFDSKKRLQYLNLLNHRTTYSNQTKKTRGIGIKTILEDFDNNLFSGGRTRSAKDSTQFEPLGLGGRNEAWPQSGLRQIWQSCQSFWHSKFAISCLDYLHTTFKILTFKHPDPEAVTMFSATKWNSKWLLLVMDSSTYTKTFKICNSFNGHFKYILMYCSAKPHWCVTGRS